MQIFMLILLFFLKFQLIICIQTDSFIEELILKPLPTGHVYADFQFTIKWDVDWLNQHDKPLQHFNLFPRALGEILSRYSVRELHLSLTQGLWRDRKWGYPVNSAPTGSELWVWFHEHTPNIDATWSELTNALSGLFCGSFSFIDATNSASPLTSLRPSGLASAEYQSNSTYLRYSVLPREITCTENLTPWKKLLPCDTKAGISTLLNAPQLYNTHFHSIGVHVRPVCRDENCVESSLELAQTLAVVFDPVVHSDGKQDWSLSRLFGNGVLRSCPMADRSTLMVDMSSNLNGGVPFTLLPSADVMKTHMASGVTRTVALYDMKNLTASGMFTLTSRYEKSHPYTTPVPPPPLHATRFISGFGQLSGGIHCHIHNTSPRKITVVYMELVPWFIQLHLHTLRISHEGGSIDPENVHYVPSQDRKRPSLLEVTFTLPASSVTKIKFNFVRGFLKWTEYPPDANHGFYIGSAVISAYLPSPLNYTAIPVNRGTILDSFQTDSNVFPIKIHTEILLVSLATPDFSMPYNVICLACTVIALAFGPLHGFTTRNLELVLPNGEFKFISYLRGKFGRKSAETHEKTE